MMHALTAEESKISFEGDLSHTHLAQIEGVGREETGVLKRATLWPKLDFLVMPLTPMNISRIEEAIVSKIAFSHGGIIHVHIEQKGKIAFAAYDNFQSVVAYPAVPVALLQDLTERRVLRGYLPSTRNAAKSP